MNQPPAFQFYPDDFIGGTVDLTAEEVGAYIRLLCYQWGRGSVPDDPEALKRVAGCTVSGNVQAKFPRRKNARLEQERRKQRDYRAKQAINGAKGGRPVKTQNNPSLSGNNPSLSFGLLKTEPKKSSPSPSPSPSPSTDSVLLPLGCTGTEDVASLPRAPKFEKPSIEMVKLQAAKIGLSDHEAEKFHCYYESNGWKVGRNPMRSWVHALTNWKNNERTYQNINGSGFSGHSKPAIVPVKGSSPVGGF